MKIEELRLQLTQELDNPLDITTTSNKGEENKKASRLMQSIVFGETDENRLSAIWINQVWSRTLH